MSDHPWVSPAEIKSALRRYGATFLGYGDRENATDGEIHWITSAGDVTGNYYDRETIVLHLEGGAVSVYGIV